MLKAPTRITLKNFTKMTLNARFTSIMKSRPPTTTQTVKAHVTTEKLASEKNRRLALQMENRHSAKPAPAPTAPSTAKLSIRERLGTVKSRLAGRINTGPKSVQMVTSTRGRGRGRGRSFSSRGGRGGKVFSGNRFSKGVIKKQKATRGRKGGAKGRGKSLPVDKTKLDSELDSYMSKTKGNMDAELDDYMASAGGN